MFCTNCGNNIPEGSKFCTNCGTAVAVAPVQTEPVVDAQFQPEVVAEPITAPIVEPQPVAPVEAQFQPEPQPQYQPQPEFQQPQVTANSEQGMNFDFSTNTATPVSASKRYEYKVLTQKDKWFSGKFDPMLLEQAMNAYAQQGWRVIGCATADITSGFGAARQEFITILEREC